MGPESRHDGGNYALVPKKETFQQDKSQVSDY